MRLPKWMRRLLGPEAKPELIEWLFRTTSKHARQRQVIKPSDRKAVVEARHKRGRKVTQYELGR